MRISRRTFIGMSLLGAAAAAGLAKSAAVAGILPLTVRPLALLRHARELLSSHFRSARARVGSEGIMRDYEQGHFHAQGEFFIAEAEELNLILERRGPL